MTSQPNGVTIATLAGGALSERVDFAIKEAVQNIMDPNTPATKKRKVVITLEMEPDEKRQRIEMDIDVDFKPAKSYKNKTTLFIGESRGEYFATEINPKQGRLFDEEKDRSVSPFPRAAGADTPNNP